MIPKLAKSIARINRDFGVRRQPDFVVEAILLSDEARAGLHHKKCATADFECVNHTTWNVISNLKDLQDFARKILVDSKGLTANIPSRVNQLKLDARDLHVRCVNPHRTRQVVDKGVIEVFRLEVRIRLEIRDDHVALAETFAAWVGE